MSVDFEKAFDKANWDVLYRIMEGFSIGPKYQKFLSILYKDAVGNVINYVINNGSWSSPSWQYKSGLQQGCPLSPYLFLLTCEYLRVTLVSNPDLEVITLPEGKCKVFPGDVWTVSKFTQKSTIVSLLHYSLTMGLKMNYDKILVLQISLMDKLDAKLYSCNPIIWTDELLNILGIWIYTDIQKSMKRNFEANFETLYLVTKDYYSVHLSNLYGRQALAR